MTSSVPLRGKDLAIATLDYIRTHPGEWNQYSFYNDTKCGTTACFAGRAVLLGLGLADPREIHGYNVAHDIRDSTEEQARELLGWTPAEAGRVFYLFTQNFTEMERVVGRILAGLYRQ